MQDGLPVDMSALGSSFHLTAAISFYMALKVYPSEAELLSIYQKTVPPAVYEVCLIGPDSPQHA